MKKTVKKIVRFVIKNYFMVVFFACIAFVAIVSFYKLFVVEPTYVYVKAKIGQGLWWASTQKPSLWFVKSIKKGDIQNDLVGSPVAEILSVNYYPTLYPNQFDVYLTLKLKVSGNNKTGKYNFNRSTIGVGAPIDLEFPSSQFSATVVEMKDRPIRNLWVEKTVYLNKSFAYPWEYETIKVGDVFLNGEEKIVEILDKWLGETTSVISQQKAIDPSNVQTRNNITVKIKLKGKLENEKFVFGEEQVIAPGKAVYINTDNFTFTDYIVSKIE